MNVVLGVLRLGFLALLLGLVFYMVWFMHRDLDRR